MVKTDCKVTTSSPYSGASEMVKIVRIVRVDWESSEFRECRENSVLRAMDRESLSACRQRGLM
jgi:hypothetical protein